MFNFSFVKYPVKLSPKVYVFSVGCEKHKKKYIKKFDGIYLVLFTTSK